MRNAIAWFQGVSPEPILKIMSNHYNCGRVSRVAGEVMDHGAEKRPFTKASKLPLCYCIALAIFPEPTKTPCPVATGQGVKLFPSQGQY
jgi:hypothetical protein